jgi:hypothetical protein
MGIRATRLAVTGPNKAIAAIDFSRHANLILGPSDTGKSYVVGCLKFALGSDTLPKQIKQASGYDQLSFQFVDSNEEPYTVFRALEGGGCLFYKGSHDSRPPENQALPDKDMNEFLLNLLGIGKMQLISAADKKGNITAGDLRHYSLFTESDTLSDAGVLGAQFTQKTRHNSAFYLMLTGIDDSAIVVGLKKDDLIREKGKLMGLDEAIDSLKAELPEDFNEDDYRLVLGKIDFQINANQNILREHSDELSKLNTEISSISQKLLNLERRRTAELETLERFRLLGEKYQNDMERLELIRTAASVFDAFTPQPCALCNTPVLQQHKTMNEKEYSAEQVAVAANAEYQKIGTLRQGLSIATKDIETELSSTKQQIDLQKEIQANLVKRHAEIAPEINNPVSHELSTLTKLHSAYVSYLKTSETLQQFEAKRQSIEPKTKKTKTKIVRNASKEISSVVLRVQELLETWGLDESQQVSFDEKTCDLRLLESPRISYGKGKRAIFLTAYSIAVMEQALKMNSPHLGFVVIDSPVLTYRDPKHGKATSDTIAVTVAEKFFSWMTKWRGPGQLVVFENEEPDGNVLNQIPHTLFVGPHSKGRQGFYP